MFVSIPLYSQGGFVPLSLSGYLFYFVFLAHWVQFSVQVSAIEVFVAKKSKKILQEVK
jgi:hypothetical protein